MNLLLSGYLTAAHANVTVAVYVSLFASAALAVVGKDGMRPGGGSPARCG